MIELDNPDEIVQLKDKRELRDALSPAVGRLVRLSYYSGVIGEPDLLVTQRVARLQEVRFKCGYSQGGSYIDESSKLRIFFGDDDYESITTGTDTVEIFQEDTGVWKCLNRAGSWKQLLDSGYEV